MWIKRKSQQLSVGTTIGSTFLKFELVKMNTIPSHEMSHMFYSRSWSQCEIESVYDKYYDPHEILIYTLLITWLILRWYQFYGVKFRGKWEGIHFEQLWFFYLFFNKWATVVFLGTSIKRNNIHFWMVLIFFIKWAPSGILLLCWESSGVKQAFESTNPQG